jgi:glyoxylase-like metal-dependent hydrolase (beta-lactamase superfamily II)
MSFTRRAMLAATPTVAAATMTNQVFAQAQSTASAAASGSRQAPGFYRFKVGDIEVTAINDGVAPRSVEGFIRNADINDVKKALRDAFLPETGYQNSYTTLVLQTGGRTVLIDTGNGDSGPPTTGLWMANFRAAGFDPAQVSTIIISHFHGDHINGMRLKDGTAVFPNAEVMVPAAEWTFWMDDAKMAQAPEGLKPGFNNVRRVFAPIAKDVKQYEAGKELVPGVTAVAAFGHSPGHMAFTIASGNSRLMMMSDATNHPALFVKNPDWSAVFDQDADMARATRRKLLDMAASERVQVSLYHAPFPATGHIARDGASYEFVPVQWTPMLL